MKRIGGLVGFSINTNVAALQGQIALQQDQTRAQTSLKRLSTGLRINSAADDPAGLIAATGLTSELTKLGAQQSGDDRLFIKASLADDVLGVVSNVLRTAKSIAVQNANSAALSQRQIDANQISLDAIVDGITRINAGTTFLGQRIFGSNVQLSSDASGASTGTADLDPTKLGAVFDPFSGQTYTLADLRSGGALADNANPAIADQVVTTALKQIAGDRASLGDFQNTLISMGNVRDITRENLADALSQIQDTDVAEETVSYVRNQTLSQAAISTMAIANHQPTNVLSLLS
jgi:flagellin